MILRLNQVKFRLVGVVVIRDVLVGDVDLKALEDIRRNWPFLRDRRIDSYGPITNRLID